VTKFIAMILMNLVTPKAVAELVLLFNKTGVIVIKLFTVIIYCHSMVKPSFCVIKLYYLSNYHGLAVNNLGIVL
jgi:hypothetical protein